MGGTVGIFNHGVAQRWGEQVGELDVGLVEQLVEVVVQAEQLGSRGVTCAGASRECKGALKYPRVWGACPHPQKTGGGRMAPAHCWSTQQTDDQWWLGRECCRPPTTRAS